MVECLWWSVMYTFQRSYLGAACKENPRKMQQYTQYMVRKYDDTRDIWCANTTIHAISGAQIRRYTRYLVRKYDDTRDIWCADTTIHAISGEQIRRYTRYLVRIYDDTRDIRCADTTIHAISGAQIRRYTRYLVRIYDDTRDIWCANTTIHTISGAQIGQYTRYPVRKYDDTYVFPICSILFETGVNPSTYTSRFIAFLFYFIFVLPFKEKCCFFQNFQGILLYMPTQNIRM